MIGTYRVRLRAMVSEYHQIAMNEADADHDTAATVLAKLLSADLTAAQILPAIDAAITECVSAGVRVLLRHARNEVIGDPINTARAANDAVNVRVIDAEHRRSA